MSRDSVRIVFKIAALNGVDVMSCNLDNAYLDAMCCENIWFKGGTECEEDKGKVLIFVKSLYGLKSTGSSWCAALAQLLKGLDLVSTLAEPDVWIREAVCEDGLKKYEMLSVYVDDILAVSHKATLIRDKVPLIPVQVLRTKTIPQI